MILFGVIGLIFCLIGIISGIYLFYEYLIGTLDPTRPFDDIYGLDDNFRNTNIDFWICSNSNKPS